MNIPRFRHVVVAVLVTAVGSLDSFAWAQAAKTPGEAIDYEKHGIRFQIKASIRPAEASLGVGRGDDKSVGTLSVKLRISAHAVGSNYFGEITETFPNFKYDEGSAERLYWQDEVCHQRRGFPKITVTSVDGTLDGDKGRVTISARPRYIGKLVPGDEIAAGIRLPAGSDKNGNFIAYRSETRQSRLFVDVKVYLIECDLTGSIPSPSVRR